jgi:tetratricopeptide (TPR) repeat protein
MMMKRRIMTLGPTSTARLVATLLVFSWCTGATASAQYVLSKTDERQPGSDDVGLVCPLKLDSQMKAWVRRVVPKRGLPEARLRGLLNGLLDSNELNIEQVAGPTATAAQAFENRKANCVAFAHLIVALAREAGLQVYFIWTSDVEGYNEKDDLRIAERHLAAGYGPASKMTVLDFRGLTGARPGRYQVISDHAAAAICHSNRGVEELLAQKVEAAVAWLEAAVQIDPELDVAWMNLGVGLRRAGNFNAAENAYQRALEINPDLVWARNNLAVLIRFLSRHNDAFVSVTNVSSRGRLYP